jgi:hypothetical protein
MGLNHYLTMKWAIKPDKTALTNGLCGNIQDCCPWPAKMNNSCSEETWGINYAKASNG